MTKGEEDSNDDDGSNSSNSSISVSIRDNNEEERALSSYLRTPAGDYTTARRQLTIGTIGRLSITTSPQTPASEPGMLTSSGSKLPLMRRKIKYQATGSGTKTRMATDESNNDGRMVHSERLRRTVPDDTFQVTQTCGDISTWEMRQRFQREFPGEPVPTSAVLLQLYKDDKAAESKRMERYKSEFPGEPIPSDEVLKKLYAAQPPWGTPVGMMKASSPSFQQSLQRLVNKSESMSTSSTHSGSTWITPDFSKDHDQFTASTSGTPSLEGIEEKSSNRKKTSSSTHFRTNEDPFHESMDSTSESMQNSSSFSSLEKIQKPSSNSKNSASFSLHRDNNHSFNRSMDSFGLSTGEEASKNLPSDVVMNSTSVASSDKIEKLVSSRRKKSTMQQDRKGQQLSHDSTGALSVETLEKPASDKSKSPRESLAGPKKEKRREKNRERSAERRRKSDPTERDRDRSRERSRKSETIDRIRERSHERSKNFETNGRARQRSVERMRKSRSRSVERKKDSDIDKNQDKNKERIKKNVRQTVAKKKSTERQTDPSILVVDEVRSSRASRTSGELPAWQLREKWRSGSRPKSTSMPISVARNSNDKASGERPRLTKAATSLDSMDDFERSFSGDPFGSATLQTKSMNKSTLGSHEDLQKSFNVDPFTTAATSSMNDPFDAFGAALDAPAFPTFDAFEIQQNQDNLFQARPNEGSNLKGGAASRSFDNLNERNTPFDNLKNNREGVKTLPVRSRSGDIPNLTVQRKRSGLALRTKSDAPLTPGVPAAMGMMLRPPTKDSRSKQADRLQQSASPGWGIDIPVDLRHKVDNDGVDNDADGISIHLHHNEAPLSPMTVATKKGPMRPMQRRGRY